MSSFYMRGGYVVSGERSLDNTRAMDFATVINPTRLLFFLSIGAFISLAILFKLDVPSYYNMICIEPIVYVAMLTIFVKPRCLMGIGGIALVSMYFVKLCIVPITTVLGGFTSIVATNIFTFYWDEGCLYIALEWVIVACSIRIFGVYYRRKESPPQGHVENDKNRLSISLHPAYYFITIGFVLLLFMLIMLNSQLINSFFFIWNMEDDTAASAGGPTWFMFKTFVEWVKPMIFFGITVRISNTSLKKSKSIILLIIAIIASIIMTEYRILSILTGLTIIGFIIGKNRNSQFIRTFVKLICICALTFAVIQMTTHGDSVNQPLANVGRLFDIYCGGYIVAAASCSVELQDGVLMFLHDTANGSFLLRHLWGTLYSTTDAINLALNSGANGTFYEMMVQCKDFFGIFAPFAIAACVWFIFYMDNNAKLERIDLYRLFYIFCGLAVAFFMVMYTFSMITNFILFKCFIWLIFIAIDRRIRVKI